MTLLGADYLGGTNFKKEMIKSHPQGWCAGIMPFTFKIPRGETAWGTVEAMAKSGKFSEIVVHLTKFDYSHKYPINQLEKEVLKNTKKLQELADKYTSVKFLASPFCESNHSRKSIEPLFHKMRKLAPNCPLVHAIWRGEEVPGTITEIHITSSKLPKKPKQEYIISLDGFGGEGTGDYTDTDVERILDAYYDARQIRWWDFRCNGKYSWKDKTPLEKRSSWPSFEYLKQRHVTLKRREGNKTWDDKRLYKPCADDHGTGGKDDKAMCILPIKEKNVSIFDSHNNVIDIMRIPPAPLDPNHEGQPKGYRYYSTKYAYQIADNAEKNTNSRQIKIHDSPLTDGDLRSGRFK